MCRQAFFSFRGILQCRRIARLKVRLSSFFNLKEKVLRNTFGSAGASSAGSVGQGLISNSVSIVIDTPRGSFGTLTRGWKMARGNVYTSLCWNSLLGVMCFVSIVILFVFSSAILACIANERGTTLGTHARLLLWIYCLERSRKASDSLDHRSLSRKCLVEGDNGFAAVDAYYYRWWCYFSHCSKRFSCLHCSS